MNCGDQQSEVSKHASQRGATLTRRAILQRGFAAVLGLAGCHNVNKTTISLPARHSVRTDQLLVMSDMKLGADHPLLEDLEQLRANVIETLDLPEQRRDVIVYLFQTELQYHQYLEMTYPGLPPRRAYFVGTPEQLAVYTFWGDRVQEDLRHELTHGILHASLKSVPLWLDEGLAEYFEVVGPELGTLNQGYVTRLSSALANQWRPSMTRLERMDEVSQMQRADYQEAWAWVHFLLHSSPENKQELLAFLNELRTTARPEPLSTRLQRWQPQIEERFLVYVASLNTFGRNVSAL